MKTKFHYVLIFLILISSCTKQPKETIIKGTVINAGSGEPIAGALVYIQDGVSNSDGFFGSGTTVGTLQEYIDTTAADGSYSIIAQGEVLNIWVEKEHYRFINSHGAYEIQSLNEGTKYNNLVLTMDAHAWFNPILKGRNCKETDSVLILGDRPYIPMGLGGGGYSVRYGNGPQQLYPGIEDGLLARGDFYYPYGIIWQENGVWTEGRIDSVYIKSLETFMDTIYY